MALLVTVVKGSQQHREYKSYGWKVESVIGNTLLMKKASHMHTTHHTPAQQKHHSEETGQTLHLYQATYGGQTRAVVAATVARARQRAAKVFKCDAGSIHITHNQQEE